MTNKPVPTNGFFKGAIIALPIGLAMWGAIALLIMKAV